MDKEIQLINEHGYEMTVVNSECYSTGFYQSREIWYCALTIKIVTKSIYKSELKGVFPIIFMKDDIPGYLDKLSKMQFDLTSFIKIEDTESDSHIALKMQEYGRVLVYGQIGGSHSENYLTFKFETDRTILPNFINFFTTLLQPSN